MLLALDKIRMDGGTQPRSIIEQPIIDEYAEFMHSGAIFPPVTVFYDGSDYWLADGFHRVNAAKLAEMGTIEADVKQGTRRDAILFSVGTNSEHGLRRTNDDKRRAVKTLLEDEEWAKWSDNQIAQRCAVTHPFVGKLRQEVSCNDYKIDLDEILATRNGTTYTQKRKKSSTPASTATAMQSAVPATPTAVLDRPEPAPDPIYTAPLISLIPEPDEEEETDLPVEMVEDEPTIDEKVAAFVTEWQDRELINLTQGQRKSLIDGILQFIDSIY